MKFSIICLLVLATVANAQVTSKNDERSFFGTGLTWTTFTLIKSTTTSTSTLTSTITCTTSTGTLTTCSAGRRRRGLFYDDSQGTLRARKGLFFSDDAVEEKPLVASPEKSSKDPVAEVLPAKTTDVKEFVVPLELQSGFVLPEGIEDNRFLLAFGTSTVTSFSITTTTTSLTAICSSVTNFPTCSSG